MKILTKLLDCEYDTNGFAGKNIDSNVVSGFALKNICQRLKLCYGEKSSMKFKSKVGSGTVVILTIPVEE